jgi:aryl sulfotransferase
VSLLQIGFPRSGNFWLYRILDGALERAGIERRRAIRHHPIREQALGWDLGGPERADMDVIDIEPDGFHLRVADRYREPIADLDAWAARSSHACSHSPWCERTPEALERFGRVVYVARDPRDAIVSLSRYAFSPFMRRQLAWYERTPRVVLARRLARLARAWTRHVEGYLPAVEAGRIRLVRFEDLVDHFDRTLASLLDDLGIALGAPEIDALTRSVGFEAMRAEAPEHLHQGRAGAWRDTLTAGQERRIRALAGIPMATLGYLDRGPD